MGLCTNLVQGLPTQQTQTTLHPQLHTATLAREVHHTGRSDSHIPTLSLTAVEVLLEDELEVLMVHGL